MKKLILTLLIAVAVLFGVTFGLKGVAETVAQRDHLYLMQTLLPGSESFVREPYSGEDANIRSVHKADNGFVIETVTRGYADDIRMMIGVDRKGNVTGLVVLEAHETLGLGSNILIDHQFLSQFLNQNGSFAIGTPGQGDAVSSATGESVSTGKETYVDGISGAMVSSKAVARCVNSAIAYVTGADAGSSATG